MPRRLIEGEDEELVRELIRESREGKRNKDNKDRRDNKDNKDGKEGKESTSKDIRGSAAKNTKLAGSDEHANTVSKDTKKSMEKSMFSDRVDIKPVAPASTEILKDKPKISSSFFTNIEKSEKKMDEPPKKTEFKPLEGFLSAPKP